MSLKNTNSSQTYIIFLSYVTRKILCLVIFLNPKLRVSIFFEILSAIDARSTPGDIKNCFYTLIKKKITRKEKRCADNYYNFVVTLTKII